MLLSVATRMDSYLQFITVLILFVFVLALTHLVTRWIANYQKEKTSIGNLEVIETCRIASNKYIQIVRAGGKYLVIAVGKDEVHMLSELSGDQLSFQKNEAETAGFAEIFDKVKKLRNKEKD
ncbi:MAG: flagellar biosynthetic protein FliO [Firmicutes bacterium]|nr:flagellar biosynthetic protein FliO [Bacillota bacterium]